VGNRHSLSRFDEDVEVWNTLSVRCFEYTDAVVVDDNPLGDAAVRVVKEDEDREVFVVSDV